MLAQHERHALPVELANHAAKEGAAVDDSDGRELPAVRSSLRGALLRAEVLRRRLHLHRERKLVIRRVVHLHLRVVQRHIHNSHRELSVRPAAIKAAFGQLPSAV